MLAATVSLALLALAIASILLPRRSALVAFVPPALAAVALAAGAVRLSSTATAARSLGGPLAFVALAVPLAVLLDSYGFFSELAELVSSRRRYLGWLWALAAVVTALLNLDAAVVLLTPLYVRVARQRRVSPFALAVQPALLSGLASSGLPISNLTNLIATARLGLTTPGFVEHLAPATLAGTLAGWFAYRARLGRLTAEVPPAPGAGAEAGAAAEAATASSAPGASADGSSGRPRSRRVLTVGGVLVAAIVSGFLVVPAAGGQPWQVAAAADGVLIALTRRVPWRSLPWESVAAVLGLGVLAEGAAAHLPLATVLSGSSPAAISRIVALGSFGSNVVNNLPALLVALHALGHASGWAVWALLAGTNAGALFAPSGTLAVLLWLATMARLGIDVRERAWWRATWPISLAGLSATWSVLLLTRLVLGGG